MKVTNESVKGYRILHDYVATVSQASSAVEPSGTTEQRLNLLVFLEALRDKTWADIKSVLSSCVRVYRRHNINSNNVDE